MTTLPETDPILTSTSIAMLARGLHADPYAVLGPHEVERDGVRGLVIRTVRPDATRVSVRSLVDSRDVEMVRLHPEGVFEAFLAGASRGGFDYALRIERARGDVEIDDPYRYGPVLSGVDEHLFAEGTHLRSFDRLGAHPMSHGLATGVHFAVWAPNAKRVSVVGDFNEWDGRVHPMRALVDSGVWEIFIPGLGSGDRYKFEILTPHGAAVLKSDPCGRYFETPPLTASIVWKADDYRWDDSDWIAARIGRRMLLDQPLSIYEVHLGSWRRGPDGRFLTYREMADTLVPYVRALRSEE